MSRALPYRWFLAIALWSFTTVARAQVNAELVLAQEHFLTGESIMVGVKITNFSGKTLKLGEDSAWLQFNVSGENNLVISREGEPNVKKPFEIPTSHVATRKVDIGPHFNLPVSGRYTITATVNIKQLGREITTRPAYINIVAGSKVWEQEFGFTTGGTAGAESTELRKYLLLQVTQKNMLKLYVRVTDSSERTVFRTFPIGGIVSFDRPEVQIDSESRLHVLSRFGSRAFNYCVITPQGDLAVRQTHEYDETFKPKLSMLDDGKLAVVGGVRRFNDTDIPAAVAASTTPAPVDPPKP